MFRTAYACLSLKQHVNQTKIAASQNPIGTSPSRFLNKTLIPLKLLDYIFIGGAILIAFLGGKFGLPENLKYAILGGSIVCATLCVINDICHVSFYILLKKERSREAEKEDS